MTNRFKDFGAGSDVRTEPLSFKLHGEDFECYPNLQGKVLLDLAAGSTTEDPAAAGKVMTDFFSAALKPESHERFEALLSDPDRIVSVETLGEITAWLVEEYSDRPTQEHSDS